MRGKRTGNIRDNFHERITPAHAGKTWLAASRAELARDHPRACGENSCAVEVSWVRLGSPPRMRGKRSLCHLSFRQRRITPAHAGKTFTDSMGYCVRQDHPRACGENVSIVSGLATAIGSPPRMRGKLIVQRHTALKDRITPAHAGKTC